ncbi:3-hydroxy-5-phosphonooxypentane-2,4-dione thiolase [Candidatus Pacearchaeota archaeon]|nr:3-hydroxy-5-phosphonooxypentane-2,4-dione thiolase [Candidatus Pacearchaeota archaeon]
MEWGLENRLSRIIKPETGRTVMLAVDHGYFLGPINKLENPRETVSPLLEYADALMLTRGILRNCIDAKTETPIVLRVSGGNSISNKEKSPEELANETITTSTQEAVRLNASAVALSIYVGTKYEHQTLKNLAMLVDEGMQYGMPVLAVTAVGKELEEKGKDAKYLALSCRIAAELGASFVKTYYCDELEKVVKGCPVPVVIAGGKKLDNELDALKIVYDSIQKGAIGVDMGRNIWQSENPAAMIKSIRAIVHGNCLLDEAYHLFNIEQLKAKTAKRLCT